jgi:hypothetical protein
MFFDGSLALFVAVAFAVFPACLIGGLIGVTPSLGRLLSNEQGLSEQYPHLVWRFVLINAALMAAYALLVIRYGRAREHDSRRVQTDGTENPASTTTPKRPTVAKAAELDGVGGLDSHGLDPEPMADAEGDTRVKLPPMTLSNEGAKPFNLEITLRQQVDWEIAADGRPLDSAYGGALRSLASGHKTEALSGLRVVIETDHSGDRRSARLLACLLSLELGDAATFSALHPSSLNNEPRDSFAAHAVDTSSVRVFYGTDGDSIELPGALQRPVVATQIAIVGSLLRLGKLDEAARLLTEIEPILGLDTLSWEAHQRTETARQERSAALHELRRAGLSEEEASERADEHARIVRARALSVIGREPPTPVADGFGLAPMPQDARASIVGLTEALCWIYMERDEPDAVLDVVSRSSSATFGFWKGAALARKGLNDAAILAYSDCIASSKATDRPAQRARYAKARLLIEAGEQMSARRELARLYANVPTFGDPEGLLERLSQKHAPNERARIPEGVRHAVWRRDEGKCVECGSDEKLEFDHIIPLSRGGANTERNLQLLCEPCNRRKGPRI